MPRTQAARQERIMLGAYVLVMAEECQYQITPSLAQWICFALKGFSHTLQETPSSPAFLRLFDQ